MRSCKRGCAGSGLRRRPARRRRRSAPSRHRRANGPRAIGQYDRGCIAGAAKLSANGPGWQVMRLSRNRFWGHPVLVGYLGRLAADCGSLTAARHAGGGHGAAYRWPAARGTCQPSVRARHRSLVYAHAQSYAVHGRAGANLGSSVVNAKTLTVDKAVWTGAQVKLLHRAASYPEVARIFVHPAVKKALCESAGTERAWLQKIRPWYRHNDHFHIRLNCPAAALLRGSGPPFRGRWLRQRTGRLVQKLRVKPKRPQSRSRPQSRCWSPTFQPNARRCWRNRAGGKDRRFGCALGRGTLRELTNVSRLVSMGIGSDRGAKGQDKPPANFGPKMNGYLWMCYTLLHNYCVLRSCSNA